MRRERTLGRKPASSQLLRPASEIGPREQAPPGSLWSEVQEHLGNARVADLVEARPSDAGDLYVADLLRISAVTGQDFTAYLPWRATNDWAEFARAWYRVLHAERERGAIGADVDVASGQAFDGASAGAVADAVGIETGGLDVAAGSAALDGATPGLTGAPGVEVAGESVARAAAGPDISDPGAMNDWFDRLMIRSGSGRALSGNERAMLEEVHGRPIPSARIHEDGVARASAAEINARAFTIGDDVWMGEKADISTPQGAELLAHEITHVIQNSLGRGQARGPVSLPGESIEVEAEARGRDAARLVSEGGWEVRPPELLDGRGRALVEWIRGQLPKDPVAPPRELVEEGLRQLLAGRAEERIAAVSRELEDARSAGEDPSVVDALAALSDARTAVGTAGAAASDLGLLLRIGGQPSDGELQGLQASFAPYPTFAQAARDTLRALAGPDPIIGLLASTPTIDADAAPVRVGGVQDVDADRAVRTAQLVADLARQLSLPAGGVAVRVDEGAAARTHALGVRGVMENGEILLDPSAYDPSTSDGMALLAHEVAHVAQESLPAAIGADAGRFAEAEAHLAADRFAAGQAIQPIEMGIPTGHVAAEGDVTGADLQALLDQYKQLNAGRKGSVTPADGNLGPGASKGGAENHEKKVADYRRGVDGVAEMISEVDGFDDLCDSQGVTLIGDPPDAGQALRKVKQSEPYTQLCEMYQGAKDGGADSETLIGIFNDEMSGRGFWESTKTAFAMIRDEARKDAKPSAEAQKGKGDLTTADANKDNPTENNGKGDGKGGGGGTAKTGNAPGGAGGDLAALMAQPVDKAMPATPAFDALNEVTDDSLARVVYERNHQKGLGQELAATGLGTSRGGQIWDTFSDNFFGSFGKSFTEQFQDTLILDTLGAGADKLLTLATKGTFKTPFIGPMIGLIQSQPWKADFWTNAEGGGVLDKFGSGGKSMASAGSNFLAAFQQGNFKDGVGVFCAALADFFSGLRDILDACATLIGTLSALCYVIGGILILAGLALCWFFGVGAPLITAGGWLVKAGGVLARINTVLGLIVIALSTLATIFRVAAAFLVPADMYAAQLGGVGTDAKAFGEKTGAKLGDATAGKIKEGVANQVKTDKSKAPDSEGDGETKGKSDAKQLKDKVEGENKKLEDTTRKIQDDAQKAKEEAERKAKEDEENKKKGDDDGTRAKVKRAIVTAVKIVGVIVTSPVKGAVQSVQDMKTEFGRITSTFKEAGKLFSDPRAAAADGLSQMRESMDQRIDKAKEKHEATKQKVDDARAKIKELSAELRTAKDGGASKTEIAEIRTKLSTAKSDLEKAKNAIKPSYEAMKEEIQKAEAWKKKMNGGKQKEADASDARLKKAEDLDAMKEDLDKKKGEKKQLEDDTKKLKQDVDETAAKLEEAKKKQAAAKTELDEAQKKLDDVKKHVDGHEKALEQKKRADSLRAKQTEMNDSAAAMNKRANDVDQARGIRKEVKSLEQSVKSTEANAEKAKKTLDSRVGKTVTFGAEGGNQTGRVVSVSPDGIVVVDKQGNQSTVGFDKVVAPNTFETAAQRYAEANKKITETKTEIETKKAEADKLDPNRDDPKNLRDRAQKKQQDAAKYDDDIAKADAKSKYDGTDKSYDEIKAEQQELSGKRNDASKKSGGANDEVTQLDGKLKSTKDTIQKKESAATKLDAEIKKLTGEYKEIEAMQQQLAYARDSSSGNATGGVGSSYKDLYEKGNGILQWFGMERPPEQYVLDGVAALTESLGIVDQFPDAAPTDPNSRGTIGDMVKQGIEGWTGAPKDIDEVKRIGAQHARTEEAVGKLMNLNAPADILAMMDHREKAKDAFSEMRDAHEQAYRAYTAEQTVDRVAAATKALAEKEGKPLHETSKATKAPIQSAVPIEEQRKQTLQGANPDTKKSDSTLTSMVMDIVAKVAEHGDRIDDSPNTGSPNGGKDVAQNQDEADKQAKERKKESVGASDEQAQVLEKALEVQALQEATIGKNIESLQDKYDSEMAIKQEIQRQKAEALQRREAAKAQVEENSSAFKTEYDALSAWAAEYKSRREAIAKIGGGGS